MSAKKRFVFYPEPKAFKSPQKRDTHFLFPDLNVVQTKMLACLKII